MWSLYCPSREQKLLQRWYLPWGELSLYAQLDVPENASQRVLRRPAAPFGFHLPALVEETQVRQAAAVPLICARAGGGYRALTHSGRHPGGIWRL